MSDKGGDMTDIIWVTKQEAAWYLGKSERTISRWIASGKLPKREVATGIMVGVSKALTDTIPNDTDSVELRNLRSEVVQLRAELERLTLLADTLTLRIKDLERDKEFWREHAESALMNQRLMIESRQKHRWWPWSRE
jgi:hypothetical protein